MASVVAEIVVETYFDRLLFALREAVETWPEYKIAKFSDDWKRLESNGAEMIDMRRIGGRFVAHPSEDFTMHCQFYGVYLS